MAQPHDVVSAAHDLFPRIVAAREEAEALRRVPPAIAEQLGAAGLLQMFLPRAMGGPELPPLAAFHAIEAVSRADGSIGWCAMIATVASLFAGWLDADVGRSIAGKPADLRLAGSLRSQGSARPVVGGYRVSGRWDFASGVHHANWLFCTCKILDGDTPRTTPSGAPLTRSMWVPAARARIEDTWSVVGLRGTGSHDFVVEDAFVPESHTSSIAEPPRQPGALYHPRMVYVTIFGANVANALGIARGALDAFADLARRSSPASPVPLRERPAVQARLGEAEAILGAARAFVVDAVGAACDAARGPDPSLAIARARLAITHGVHEAVRAVDLVFHAAGTLAIHTENPLERYFRDIHVAVQHNAAFPVHYESAGKVFLGLAPPDVGW
jgi:alkylation response protein AidB-like acyl-CoA dehydrogenase